MFYWDHKGIFLILTDREELELVKNLSGGNPVEIISYDTSQETRKKYEKKIFKYLKSFLNENSDEFNRKYVFRSCYDTEAIDLFPKYLDAYGRATKNATFGVYGGDPLQDDDVESIIYVKEDNLYHVTLFDRSLKAKALGRITFPASLIEKLVGTVDNFVLIAKIFDIRFGRDFIRVSIRNREKT